MTDLPAAIARFNEWRQSLGDPGLVDEDSGMTTEDLDVIAAHLEATKDMVAIEYASLDDLAKRAKR